MERETERLNEIVSTLLELARLTSGVSRLHKESIDITGIVESVSADADFEARAEGKQVVLTPHHPVRIAGDQARLHGAIENVVRNGIRYTAPGTAVEIELQADAARVRIFVRDHGPGVPDEMLNSVFEPFVRVSEARERGSGGYGLGLAIAEQAISLHGGTIAAENADPGLRVTITLPVQAAD
jgi:two-component system sensor histidine kinase CpxA